MLSAEGLAGEYKLKTKSQKAMGSSEWVKGVNGQ
jgi:hypothetical protein